MKGYLFRISVVSFISLELAYKFIEAYGKSYITWHNILTTIWFTFQEILHDLNKNDITFS